MTQTNAGILRDAKLAIVVSEFNVEMTDGLLASAMQRLAEYGYSPAQIKLVQVPGAVEIPYVAQLLAESKKFEAIIALGAVIRGDTSHYDYVCEQVSQGCQRVMLDYQLPIVFGVLTTENEAQAEARLGNGASAVDTALKMIAISRTLRSHS